MFMDFRGKKLYLIRSKKERKNKRQAHVFPKQDFVNTKNDFSVVCGCLDSSMTLLINGAFLFVTGENQI